jgi:hypothetical protein
MMVEFKLPKTKMLLRLFQDDNPASLDSIVLEIVDGQRVEKLAFPPRLAGVLGRALVMLAEGH